MSGDKPLVDARLSMRGKFRLRDLEEIMVRIRDEFGITTFTLQIDQNMYHGGTYEQTVVLEPVERPHIQSAYHRFVSLKMGEGYTLPQAAQLWQEQKQKIKETS